MMAKLIRKEFVLCMHPTAPMMLLLSAMVFIPNYPYSVIFFYVTLSIFFTCLSGRENKDVEYSAMLPIAKRDVVRSRICFAAIIELSQLAVMAPLVILKGSVSPGTNGAGMDANIALFGVGLLDYGVFNLVFFSGYYKEVSKVGRAFVLASVAVFALITAEVAATYALSFVRDRLDTPDPGFTPEKLAFLAAGAILYAVLTLAAYKRAAREFEKQDI